MTTDRCGISRKGRGFELEAESLVGAPLNVVFDFFADARNLDLLTPPFLKFQVITPDPIVMRPGALMDYRLRLRGLPMSWKSEITAWEPPNRFVDEQRRGPYRRWVHEHLFSENGGATSITDRVYYEVTGGRLIHDFLVRKDLMRIFQYRQLQLRTMFAAADLGTDGILATDGAQVAECGLTVG